MIHAYNQHAGTYNMLRAKWPLAKDDLMEDDDMLARHVFTWSMGHVSKGHVPCMCSEVRKRGFRGTVMLDTLTGV
ncbi:hypothetical protein NHX12_008217 [Muraenolepis orangiensis]|uniref:Uncharacterized protein n=1 Tax=Muraenolepis orangiensis TaxID=630683 RepID=A0A9Q0I9Z5_9TELE|nr:hypothetical protein NHX12_008217 [Muraenolepis orangiensis]